ncbi:MAG: endonuclease/exonuclease/phosphatase family protein [Patescibacteria group bacterium]
MKVISLNIWGMQIEKPLREFFESNKHIDIFCLQELYNKANSHSTELEKYYSGKNYNCTDEIQDILIEHSLFFSPVIEDMFGIGVFIKKGIRVLDNGEVVIHKHEDYMKKDTHHKYSGYHDRKLQWLRLESEGSEFVLVNVHCLWNGMGKTDTTDRLRQSEIIKQFLNSISLPVVVCGDFNLRPETESMKMIESGLVNLVKTHNIESTRTSLYKKNEKFADYILVTPAVTVGAFEVLPDEVSDHAALHLDFQI